MTWVLVIGVGWLLLAALVAVVIGRSVRLADAKAAAEASADEPNFVVDPATAPTRIPCRHGPPLPGPCGRGKPPAGPTGPRHPHDSRHPGRPSAGTRGKSFRQPRGPDPQVWAGLTSPPAG